MTAVTELQEALEMSWFLVEEGQALKRKATVDGCREVGTGRASLFSVLDCLPCTFPLSQTLDGLFDSVCDLGAG